MNSTRNRAGLLALVAVAVATATASPGTAQTKTRQTPAVRVSADRIMEDYIAATGGRAAYAGLKSMVTSGTLAVEAQKITGTMRIEYKSPNRFRAVQSISGFGESAQGFDGKTAWAKDPLNGIRELKGAEMEQAKTQSAMNPALNWRSQYKKVEVLGLRKVAGSDAYAVRLTPKSGKPTTQYFDAKSKLLVRIDAMVESPNGALPTETYLSGYKSFGGFKQPTQMRQLVGGISEVKITFDKVETNVPIDDSVFAKPKE